MTDSEHTNLGFVRFDTFYSLLHLVDLAEDKLHVFLQLEQLHNMEIQIQINLASIASHAAPGPKEKISLIDLLELAWVLASLGARLELASSPLFARSPHFFGR